MGRLVEIAHFYDPEEAYCARGFLRSCGIETIIQNEHHLTAAPWLRIALGGYRLMTRSEFENDAREALGSIEEEKSTSAETTMGEAEPAAVQERQKRNWLWLPMAFAWAVPFMPTKRKGWVGLLQLVALILLYITFVFAMWAAFPFN